MCSRMLFIDLRLRLASFPNLRFQKEGTWKNDVIWLQCLDGLLSSVMLDPLFVQHRSLVLISFSSSLNITFITMLSVLKSMAPGKQGSLCVEFAAIQLQHLLFLRLFKIVVPLNNKKRSAVMWTCVPLYFPQRAFDVQWCHIDNLQ